MLNNLKLNTQLQLSFGLIISLLVISSIIAYTGLSKTYTGFVEYRKLARDTNLAGRVQANMLMMRLSALAFISTRSEDKVTQFDERREKMETFLHQAETDIQEPNRARLIQEVVGEVETYKNGFSSVVELFQERNEVVSSRLDPAGLAMRQATTQIIKTAYNDGDPDAAYYASRVQEHLLLGRLFVTKYLVTNDINDANRAISELDEKMGASLQRLDGQIQNPNRRKLMKRVIDEHDRYIAAFNDVKRIIEERNDLINNTLNRIGPIVASNVEEVKLSVKKEQDKLGPEVQSSAENANTLVATFSALAIFIGIACSVFMAKIIRRPIGGEPNEIAQIAQEISKGDFSQNLPLNDQHSGIYRSVVEMSQELQTLIRSMLSTSRSLTKSANESSSIASQNATRVKKQKQMTDQVVVAVEEMSTSIREIVNNAAESANKSEQGLEEASKGRDSVKETLNSVNLLATELGDAMSVITDLEKQSNEIGSVVEVIQSISEQTNLLALNAAIEAARAGEQGRGFAVVADEVRTLAQRTQQSTAEIQTIIQNLQMGTSKTVEVMEKSTKQAQDTAERSATIDVALSAIQSLINDIALMNSQVATAVDEQSHVTGEITTNITSISDQLDETTEAVAEAQLASDKVKTLSTELDTMASNFKV